jgi:hypothetical protein
LSLPVSRKRILSGPALTDTVEHLGMELAQKAKVLQRGIVCCPTWL